MKRVGKFLDHFEHTTEFVQNIHDFFEVVRTNELFDPDKVFDLCNEFENKRKRIDCSR